MTYLNDIVDEELVDDMINEGYISARRHPELPLIVLNYTKLAQIEYLWNEATINCRGLIIDDDSKVVARPFPKFFNHSEFPPIELSEFGYFRVFEKMDGSLGVLWNYEGQSGIATRGSFESEQALWATNFIADRQVPQNSHETTFLFEIIYPENRIVVDYEGMKDLVCLGAVDVTTGATVASDEWAYSHVLEYTNLSDMAPHELPALSEANREGFVLFYPHKNKRVKVKFEDYVELHRIVTGLNAKKVFEMTRDDNLAELLDVIPDELDQKVQHLAAMFKDMYFSLLFEVTNKFRIIQSKTETRKEFAELAKQSRYAGLLFAILDGKIDVKNPKYSNRAIWDYIADTNDIKSYDIYLTTRSEGE